MASRFGPPLTPGAAMPPMGPPTPGGMPPLGASPMPPMMPAKAVKKIAKKATKSKPTAKGKRK